MGKPFGKRNTMPGTGSMIKEDRKVKSNLSLTDSGITADLKKTSYSAGRNQELSSDSRTSEPRVLFPKEIKKTSY